MTALPLGVGTSKGETHVSIILRVAPRAGVLQCEAVAAAAGAEAAVGPAPGADPGADPGRAEDGPASLRVSLSVRPVRAQFGESGRVASVQLVQL